ncbi:RagB/SusD family nutrient uptake outer membrane protein [Paradesertivirga mongoliensis]|uniref:RagB/SusD family nutrient uptake outer membrane protein n=1 Tax=Paradesertivirga mongoliensis TaxID=2100740 RepID=A0ABW4ZME4_9SPHI|nr:RagB/SusD family nutrient uptake outer membrane protein [Pedobacter mongoliensis]
METKFLQKYDTGKSISNKFSSMPLKKALLAGALILAVAITGTSCKKFLDVVPDNTSEIKHAFKIRNEAEKYLFTCYSFLPKNGDGWFNAGMFAGDEMWLPQNDFAHWHNAFRIAQGQQNANAPLFDEWAGLRKGGGNFNSHLKIFMGIRHCNIFIENMKDMSKVPDITLTERERWIGEAMFLKAFYHYYLLRMYGPVPIIDQNSAEDATGDELYYKRMPVDDVVNYVSGVLDEALDKVPTTISQENTELGRVDKNIVLAVKAKLWLLAASPLFNGNPDYAGFKDKDGVALFNSTYDPLKWEKARDAAKDAILAAESTGHFLYKYTDVRYKLSDTTKKQLSIRNAITSRWNPETVWGLSNSYFINEALCMPAVARGRNTDRFQLMGVWGAPIKIAKMFYTKNGVPIEEDKTLNFSNYTEVRTAGADDRFNIEQGYQTARLNFDREHRFYADLGFDGGIWYMKDANEQGNDVDNRFFVQAKNSERSGFGHFTNWNHTGYFIKKLVNWESTTNSQNQGPSWKAYPWPEIRLADLYLMYAEALNEVQSGSTLAIEYVDKVRDRAGLKGVVESWTNYSNNPGKYISQSGLRQIIQHERLIELAFEGQRFWDLRRWKRSGEELNKDITGFNILGKTTESYNTERFIFSQTFIAPRDYFWPIGNYDTRRNPKLVENLGW